MTFYPDKGLKSVEHFLDASGISGSNTGLQSVVNGFVALLPQIERSVSYFNQWSAISGWTINNGLSNLTTLRTDFTVTGGYVNNLILTGITGYQRSTFGGGSWEVYTPECSGSGINITGATYQYFALWSGSPNTKFFSGNEPTNHPFTFEFDVASTYVSSGSIVGYTSGQNTLTGLPRLSGSINHGIYVSNGTNWDYLECRPDGIRSINHPELAIGVGLNQPKRFRVGIESNNLYILCENGRSVAGISKFDTPVYTGYADRPILAFGAPPHSGYNIFSFTGIYGIVGHSYWDNIKVLTGKLALEVPTGLERIYTTTQQSLRTSPFSPGLAISKWQDAVIEYDYYPGGTTIITPEYIFSGAYITASSLAKTLTSSGVTARIDLSSIPVSNTINLLTGTYNIDQPIAAYNTIRFKIDQVSTNGSAQAPIVDAITVTARKEGGFLDSIPNWAPKNKNTSVLLKIKTEEFLNTVPDVDAYSTFYYRAPVATGLIYGSFTDLSIYNITGNIRGTGELYSYGPWNAAFQNYSYLSGYYLSGTSGSKIFGIKEIYNFIPDPTFDKGFKSVSALPTYVGSGLSGKIFGDIGQYLYIPNAYTGDAIMTFEKVKVIRPYKQESDNVDYAQKVTIQNTTGIYNTNAGLTIWIPSGIYYTNPVAPQGYVFSMDLRILNGSGVYLTGENFSSSSIYLDPTHYSDYRRASIILATGIATNNSYLKLYVATGYSGKYEFIIDNLALRPFITARIEATGVPSLYHTVGSSNLLLFPQVFSSGKDLAERAATVIGVDLYLDSYPTGSNILFRKLRTSDSKGVTLSINNDGYPIASFDIAQRSWYTGSITGIFGIVTGGNFGINNNTDYIKNYTITGASKIPLGYWSHLGFIHESWNHSNYGIRNVTGHHVLPNQASCNRAYLAIDGLPVVTTDTCEFWRTYVSTGALGTGYDAYKDAGPFATMVADGTGNIVIASGLFCKLDNAFMSRPPVADLESEIYIKTAKIGVPYFMPDEHVKPGHKTQTTGSTPAYPLGMPGFDPFANSYYLASSFAANLYPLDNPGPYTNWDHGNNRNHLLFYGSNVSKDTNNPYKTGLGSTRFGSGSYAVSPYSSSLERVINDSSLWPGLSLPYPIPSLLSEMKGRIYFGSWIYPRTTGEFITIYNDPANRSGHKIAASITDANTIKLINYNSTGAATATITHTPITSNGDSINLLNRWTHLGFFYQWRAFTGSGVYSAHIAMDGAIAAAVGDTIGTGVGFLYSGNSAIYYGYNSDVNMCDAYTLVDPYNEQELILFNIVPIVNYSALASSGDKGGLFSKLYINDTPFTGLTGVSNSHKINGFDSYSIIVNSSQIIDEDDDLNIWVGTNNNQAEEVPNVAGLALYNNVPFKFADSYIMSYDDTQVNASFGATDSPIKIGNVVPEHAINIARFDSPEYSTAASISTVDLSDKNPGNLLAYRGGKFTLNKTNQHLTGTAASGLFKGINSDRYSGQVDVVYTKQSDTNNIRLTSLSIASKDGPCSEAFYAYLVGRGLYGVQIPDYMSNISGVITSTLSGVRVPNYIYNLENIKKSIYVTDNKGKTGSILWDVVYSPYSPSGLDFAIASGINIAVDGIGPTTHQTTLPSGIYSVILLVNEIPKETMWVQYNSYRYSDGLVGSKKEIINPIPVMREHRSFEAALGGQYSVTPSSDGKGYTVTIHGVYSGYSGVFV